MAHLIIQPAATPGLSRISGVRIKVSTSNATNLPCVLATGQVGNTSELSAAAPVPGLQLSQAGLCPIVAGDVPFLIGAMPLAVLSHTAASMATRDGGLPAFVRFSMSVHQSQAEVVTPSIRTSFGRGPSGALELPSFLKNMHEAGVARRRDRAAGGRSLMSASQIHGDTDGDGVFDVTDCLFAQVRPLLRCNPGMH